MEHRTFQCVNWALVHGSLGIQVRPAFKVSEFSSTINAGIFVA